MRYLDFTTHSANPNTRFSLGAPVHDGKMPNKHDEIESVRINGEPIHFIDKTLIGRLENVLKNRKSYVRNGNFECTDFAGLMMEHPEMSPKGMMPYSTEKSGKQVDPYDTSVNQPVNLYMPETELNNGSWNHIVVPAHTTEGAMYIHKLGAGPLCISGLTKALEMYSCDSAYVAQMQLSS